MTVVFIAEVRIELIDDDGHAMLFKTREVFDVGQERIRSGEVACLIHHEDILSHPFILQADKIMCCNPVGARNDVSNGSNRHKVVGFWTGITRARKSVDPTSIRKEDYLLTVMGRDV